MTERQREVGDKESCFAEDEKAQADDRTTSSFLHAVINMVGMLIGKFTGSQISDLAHH